MQVTRAGRPRTASPQRGERWSHPSGGHLASECSAAPECPGRHLPKPASRGGKSCWATAAVAKRPARPAARCRGQHCRRPRRRGWAAGPPSCPRHTRWGRCSGRRRWRHLLAGGPQPPSCQHRPRRRWRWPRCRPPAARWRGQQRPRAAEAPAPASLVAAKALAAPAWAAAARPKKCRTHRASSASPTRPRAGGPRTSLYAMTIFSPEVGEYGRRPLGDASLSIIAPTSTVARLARSDSVL